MYVIELLKNKKTLILCVSLRTDSRIDGCKKLFKELQACKSLLTYFLNLKELSNEQ